MPPGSGGLNGPTGIVFGPDSNLYVGSGATNSILRFQGQTGAFLGAFVSSGSGGLNGPIGLAFGPDVNLYVASYLGNSVLRDDGQSGAFLNAFIPAGSGGLVNPAWLLFPPPDAPTGLTGWSASPTQINLYWSDQSTDETAFAIWRRSDTGSFARVGVVGANVTAYSDTAVSPGTTYTYRVRAISNVGASLWSNDWISHSLSTPPVAPSDLIATVISPTQITLAWADNSSNETGFAVFRKSGAAEFACVGAIGANTTTFADPSLMTGTTYTYRVAAVAADGSLTWSGEAVGALVPPAAPTGLSAVVTSATQITLTWTDNSNNETAFAVWRKTGTGTYSRVGVVAPSTARFVDSGLAANTTYTYEVRATNNVGASGWTNEATRATPP